MKTRPDKMMEKCRFTADRRAASTPADGNNGAFKFSYKGAVLCVIASDGRGWDHVSVHCEGRTPTWEEMHWVKRLFWRDDETVVQYHPPKHLYVDQHPYTLHLWKDQSSENPLPPTDCV